MTPIQRTIRELKNRGLVCAIVEKWNRFAPRPGGGAGIRQDLFGIIDVLALDPSRGVVGVQVTTGNCFPDHYRKITEERVQETLQWLETPGTVLELWAWRKIKTKRGGKAQVWSPRIAEITMGDLI